MSETINKREKAMAFMYVVLLFIIIAGSCCTIIYYLNLNTGFRPSMQKVAAVEKMQRIKEFQNTQAEVSPVLDSLFARISRFNPGVYAQHEENDIQYMLNDIRKIHDRHAYDARYKVFLHIPEFYDIWFNDKKELRIKNSNIATFKRDLENCEIGLSRRRDDLRNRNR